MHDTPEATPASTSQEGAGEAGLGRVVIGGSSGFIGRHLVAKYRAEGREVVTISRSNADLTWDDEDGIAAAVDGAALVIGLAGKSVGCRYTAKNREEIFTSRLSTTTALSDAIAAADNPPPLWINASTATIYRHADDRPMTESGGEIGEGFSVDVARAWERALFAADLPATRRVALRTAIVLGRDTSEAATGSGAGSRNGALGPLINLARIGLGGAQYDGRWPATPGRRRAGTAHVYGTPGARQRFSWIHLDDVAGIIDFLEDHPELDGPINAAAPNPSDNRGFMAAIRAATGMPVGLPVARWMLEIGAIAIRTETELVLKSRWVLPERLQAAGYEFAYPELEPAVDDAVNG
ncbi:DUF1731 domain-containing protein [Brevibacterium luteolum]|uniref:DUF1731 domain-containing protein n=2 Tax=Brevibacterium luteolum TaxID=199591 RepID=A0A6G8L0T5_9MICO|nr:DUF1731 domain-containing protein [Brevibacterium luteolum]